MYAQITHQAKIKSPVKSFLSFKSWSQASGWITVEAEYIKAKFQAEAFRFRVKVDILIISKLFNIL
jgi:hypothetical protein